MEWLSSKEAARRLGISPATLYATEPRSACAPRAPMASASGATGRRRGTTQAPPRCRRKAESIAAHALDFGTPVLESSLTLIENGRLFYRGHDAARLARNGSLEQVAQLLWDCDDRPFAPSNLPSDVGRAPQRLAGRLGPAAGRCLPRPSCPRRLAGTIGAWVEDRSAMLEPACGASCACWRPP